MAEGWLDYGRGLTRPDIADAAAAAAWALSRDASRAGDAARGGREAPSERAGAERD